MKNIVTIDFDIIMAPSIPLYNNEAARWNWDVLLDNIPLAQFFTCDMFHYQTLTNYILRCSKILPKEKIHFIFNHNDVLKYLPKDEPYCLVNIDHHHDVYYNEEDMKPDNYNCGNWVLHAKQDTQLSRYIWINNKTSSPLEKRDDNDYIDEIIDIKTQNFDALATPNELIICLSPEWVPPYIRPLFYTWMDMLNNHYDTFYNIED